MKHFFLKMNMNLDLRGLPLAAAATKVEILNEQYIAVQFSGAHKCIFCCMTGDAVFTHRSERHTTASVTLLSVCDSVSVIAIYDGYLDGGCELILLNLPDLSGPRNSLFDISPGATIKAKYVVHAFKSAVSIITAADTGDFVLIFDRSGTCLYSKPGTGPLCPDFAQLIFTEQLRHSPVCCCVFSCIDAARLPVWCSDSIPLCAEPTRRSAVIVGFNDGNIDKFVIGIHKDGVGRSDVTSLPQLSSAAVGMFLVSGNSCDATSGLMDHAKLVVVLRNGTVSILTHSGQIILVSSIVSIPSFRYKGSEEALPVNAAFMFRLRFLVVHFAHNIYVADMRAIANCEGNLYISNPKFTLMNSAVVVSAVSWTDSALAISLCNGGFVHCRLPVPSSGDMETDEFFDYDVLKEISICFDVPQKFNDGYPLKENELRVEANRQRLVEALQREKELISRIAHADEAIRRFIALSRILQREENRKDPLNCLLSYGIISVKLQNLRFSNVGNVSIIVTITSSDMDYVRAINGRPAIFSLHKTGLAASTDAVQSYSCGLKFMTSGEGASYFAEAVFPAELDSASRFTLDIEVEISMMIPTSCQFQHLQMTSLASSSPSFHSKQSKYTGFLLSLGCLSLYPSDILNELRNVGSILTAAQNKELLKHITTDRGRLSLSIEIPIIPTNAANSVSTLSSVVDRITRNARTAPEPIPFTAFAMRSGIPSVADEKVSLFSPRVQISTTDLESKIRGAGEASAVIECINLSGIDAVDVLVAHSHEILCAVMKDLLALPFADTGMNYPISQLELDPFIGCSLPPDLLEASSQLAFLLCNLKREEEAFVSRRADVIDNDACKSKQLLEYAYFAMSLYFKVRNSKVR